MSAELVKRLRGACESVGGGLGCKCSLNEAAARIEQLERELRVYMDAAEGHMVERLRQLDELAAEKALADRLYDTGDNTGMAWAKARDAYRKARGL